jgi:hypothetical protein
VILSFLIALPPFLVLFIRLLPSLLTAARGFLLLVRLLLCHGGGAALPVLLRRRRVLCVCVCM